MELKYERLKDGLRRKIHHDCVRCGYMCGEHSVSVRSVTMDVAIPHVKDKTPPICFIVMPEADIQELRHVDVFLKKVCQRPVWIFCQALLPKGINEHEKKYAHMIGFADDGTVMVDNKKVSDFVYEVIGKIAAPF